MNRIFFAAFLLISQVSTAQNPLPEFSVTTRGKGKTIIGWYNAYPKVTQISIQRSFDSLRNYKTILTVPDPTVPQNGFVDAKAPTDFQYYRLFIVLDSGKYIFTKPKKAFWDTAAGTAERPPPRPLNNGRVIPADPIKEKNTTPVEKTLEPERIFYVKKLDTLLGQLLESDLRRLRDSILHKTKDTLVFKTLDTLLIKPFVPKEVYKPSLYVFTARDGNITIALPDFANKKYSIRFFEENSTPLFELKQIKESPLTLDKANFLHAGWFRFELYENGQLKEKHRFYIPKDF
ncbi:MAG TPA: hypothetical protein VD993_20995 [Chitinophagaceae bacterium]|nr:hypothetical protein [Chitinophagaceae bacterium]